MASSQHRPYQGYPYVNPMVTDVPTISPDVANRWANLPRRPIGQPCIVGQTAGCSGLQNTTRGNGEESSSHSQQPLPTKRDPADTPVIYIDLPENNTSDVTETMESQDPNENFVQDTIMYDPFEDRRINIGKRIEDPGSTCSSTSEASSGQGGSRPQFNSPGTPLRPVPPNHLDLNRLPSPTSSHGSSSTGNTRSPYVPPFLKNETNVYGGDREGYSLPVTDAAFPEPPPSYSETECTGRPNNSEHGTPAIIYQPARTQVITMGGPSSPVGLPSCQRKYVTCHHCGSNVHTLVIKQNGTTTHIIAFFFFIIAMPLILLVYCTDIFKQKNHYCPNCNRLIGYITPVFGDKINYVD